MLCEECKINDATIKYTQNINGITITNNLCKDCLEKVKYKNNFIDNFFNSFFSSYILTDKNKKNIKCNVCGNSLQSLKNNGKIGCENCYIMFKDNLDTILDNIQYKNLHIGKTPKNINLYKSDKNIIPHLKTQLDIAIKNENYEEAIRLRDKIKELERGDI